MRRAKHDQIRLHIVSILGDGVCDMTCGDLSFFPEVLGFLLEREREVDGLKATFKQRFKFGLFFGDELLRGVL